MLNRRSLIARGAISAATVALTAGPALRSAFALGEPGQLAALVHRYFAEVDAFNTRALAGEFPDEEAEQSGG
jgi:hypothetical protein